MSENISNKIIDRRDDEDYPFKKRVINYRKLARFYFLPILSVIIFLIILIFTIIPSVKYMLTGLDEVKALQNESDTLDARIKRLEELKQAEAQNKELLKKINALIPSEKSEVVNFRQRVAQIGKTNGLEVDSLRAGETILDEDNSTSIEAKSDQTFSLIEIPSGFSLTGRFESFRKLLQQLYEGNDFFVVSNMDLDVSTLNGSDSTWKGEFDLIKYQFSEESKEANYLEVPDDEPVNQAVIKFIEDNFIEGNL